MRDRSGATAAEFGLVLIPLLLLLFGIIDAGRFAWEYNRAEKATQVGARVAVVTSPLAPNLAMKNYIGVSVGSTILTQGDRIPAAALGLIRCNNNSCTCITTPCPDPLGTYPSTIFSTVLLPRMRQMKPDLTAASVLVEYRGSGLGFAGDPNGSQISPLVTVKLTGLTFSPIMLLGRVPFAMPAFATTLTAEDLAGTTYN